MEQAAKPRSGRAGVELAPAATRRNLEIRTAQDADIPAIVDLARRVYPGQLPYSTGQIRGQINAFPEGQFVVTYDGQIVGYAATFIIARSFSLPTIWRGFRLPN